MGLLDRLGGSDKRGDKRRRRRRSSSASSAHRSRRIEATDDSDLREANQAATRPVASDHDDDDAHGLTLWRWARRGALTTAGLALAVIAIWLLARAGTGLGDHTQLFRLMNYGTPWIVLGLFGLTLALLVLRAHRVALAAAILSALAALPLFSTLPQADPSALAGLTDRHLRVMTFNMSTRNRDMDAIARAIAVEDPDILLAQEVANPPGLVSALREHWPAGARHAATLDKAGLLIAGRIPLSRLRSEAGMLSATADTPLGPIEVSTFHAVRGIGDERAQQAMLDAVIADIDASSLPRILGGDFNMTPYNRGHMALTARLADAHAEAGDGFGFTFPAEARDMGGIVPAAVRIDYLFASPSLLPLKAGPADAAAGSDHYPVMADYTLRRPGGPTVR